MKKREQLSKKKLELKDVAADSYNEVYDKAEDLVKTTKDRAVELSQKGQVVLEEQKSKLAGVGKKESKRQLPRN